MLIIMLMVFAAPQKAYSGPIGDWIKEKVNDSVSTMADEMLSGLGQRVSETIEALGNDIVNGMVQSLGPDLKAFDNFVSGRDINADATEYRDVHNKFTTVAQVFGYGIALIILIISLLQFFISKPGELKDTPFRIIFKFILAIGLIAGSREIMDMILEVANNIWTDVIMTEVVNGKTLTLSYDTLAPVTVSEGDKQIGIELLVNSSKTFMFGGLMAIVPGIAAFIGLFQLLIYWPLIKGFVKLYIEIVERYLVVVLLYFFFGAAAGTIVSNNTSNVFKSYMRMVASQIFLLFVNAALLSVFIDALLRKAFTVSIPNYIFGLAFLKVCQRIDSYMASLGLNVAQTGGQTLDAILGAGAGILRGLGSLGRTAGSGANLASAVAEKGGHFKTAAGLKAISGVRGASDVIGAGGIDSAARLMAANRGKSFSATPDQAAAMLKDYMSDPNNMKKASMIAGYDDQSLVAGMNKIMADSGQNVHVSGIDRSSLNKHGQLRFTGTAGTGENAQNISGTYSMSEIPKADNNIKAGGGYVSFDNRLKQNPGEIHKGDANSLGAASGKSKIINSASDGFKSQIAGMSYDSATGDCALYDKDQNQIGTIAKINGKEQLVTSAAPQKDKDGKASVASQGVSYNAYGDNSFEGELPNGEKYDGQGRADNNKGQIQDAMGFKSLEFTKVDPETGEAHATATMENKFGGDDKKVDVVMRDVGMHGRTGEGKVVTTSEGHAFEIQTAAPSKNKVNTEASKGEGEGDNGGQGDKGKPTTPPESGGNSRKNGSNTAESRTVTPQKGSATATSSGSNKASGKSGSSSSPKTVQSAGENKKAAPTGTKGSSTSTTKNGSDTTGNGSRTVVPQEGSATATGSGSNKTSERSGSNSSPKTIQSTGESGKAAPTVAKGSSTSTTKNGSSTTGNGNRTVTPQKGSATATGSDSSKASGKSGSSNSPKTIQSAGESGKAAPTVAKGSSTSASKNGSSTAGSGSRTVAPQKGSTTATGSGSSKASGKSGSSSSPKTIQSAGGNSSTTSRRPVSSHNSSAKSSTSGSTGNNSTSSSSSGGSKRSAQEPSGESEVHRGRTVGNDSQQNFNTGADSAPSKSEKREMSSLQDYEINNVSDTENEYPDKGLEDMKQLTDDNLHMSSKEDYETPTETPDDNYDEPYEEEREDHDDLTETPVDDEGDDIDSLLQWRKLNKNISNDSADGEIIT